MENFCKRIAVPLSRFAIFLVYFWFGAIKVFSNHGAANPMVTSLLQHTMPFFQPNLFLICFGLFEMLIGLFFLFPRLTKIASGLITIHLFTTILPLFIMPEYTWQSFLAPTIEGQYIVKNILIVSLAVVIFASLPAPKENV